MGGIHSLKRVSGEWAIPTIPRQGVIRRSDRRSDNKVEEFGCQAEQANPERLSTTPKVLLVAGRIPLLAVRSHSIVPRDYSSP